jgi:hypothetical protein
MVQADIMNNGGASVLHIRAAFAAHGISLAAPATSLPMPLAGGAVAPAAAARDLRARLRAPKGAKLSFTAVSSDLHGNMAHVVAYKPLRLGGVVLKGLQIMVPAVARVQVKGRAIVGMLGEVMPVAGDEEAQAQAFAQALVANGDLVLQGARAVARKLPRRPTHVVRTVGGRRRLVRRGFACC